MRFRPFYSAGSSSVPFLGGLVGGPVDPTDVRFSHLARYSIATPPELWGTASRDPAELLATFDDGEVSSVAEDMRRIWAHDRTPAGKAAVRRALYDARTMAALDAIEEAARHPYEEP